MKIFGFKLGSRGVALIGVATIGYLLLERRLNKRKEVKAVEKSDEEINKSSKKANNESKIVNREPTKNEKQRKKEERIKNIIKSSNNTEEIVEKLSKDLIENGYYRSKEDFLRIIICNIYTYSDDSATYLSDAPKSVIELENFLRDKNLYKSYINKIRGNKKSEKKKFIYCYENQ